MEDVAHKKSHGRGENRGRFAIPNLLFTLLKGRYTPLFIFFLSLAVRLVYLYQIRDTPLFDAPQIDSKVYVEQAREIANGDWVGEAPFYQAPLYPYLLGLLFTLFGSNLLIPRLVQVVLGAASCLLLYWLGRRFFSPAIALVAALVAALYAPLLYFDGELLPTSIAIFLDLLLLVLLLRTTDTPSTVRWWVCGLVAGVSALTVPNILLFVPVTVIFIALQRGTKGAAVFLLGTALIILPVTTRNYTVSQGEIILISHNAGLNFYIGNNPDYDRTVGIRPGPAWTALTARPRLEAGLTRPSDQSRYFFSQAWTFIRESPGEYLALLGKKIALFWRGDEIRRNLDIYAARSDSPLLFLLLWKQWIAFPFGLVAPLALVGLTILLLTPSLRRNLALPIAFVVSYTVSVVLFFVADRYRLPVVPLLILFATFAASWGVERLRRAEYRPFALLAASILLFLLLVNAPSWTSGETRPEDVAETQYYLGMAYVDLEMFTKATEAFHTALSIDPRHTESRAKLADLYLQSGRLSEAELENRTLADLPPYRFASLFNLAEIALRRHEPDRAIDIYHHALVASPDSASVYFGLGNAYRVKGLWNEAETAYRRALTIDPKRVEVFYNLAFIEAASGRYQEAIDSYQRLFTIAPGHRQARHNLGAAFLQAGRVDQAIETFRALLAADSTFVKARWNLAIAYGKAGRYDEAIKEVQHLITHDPDDMEAHRYLAYLYEKKGDLLRSRQAMERYRSLNLRELAERMAVEQAQMMLDQIWKHREK